MFLLGLLLVFLLGMWFVFTFEVQLLHLKMFLGFLPGGPSQRSKMFLAVPLQTRLSMALKLFASKAAVNCRTHLQFGEEQSGVAICDVSMMSTRSTKFITVLTS